METLWGPIHSPVLFPVCFYVEGLRVGSLVGWLLACFLSSSSSFSSFVALKKESDFSKHDWYTYVTRFY